MTGHFQYPHFQRGPQISFARKINDLGLSSRKDRKTKHKFSRYDVDLGPHSCAKSPSILHASAFGTCGELNYFSGLYCVEIMAVASIGTEAGSEDFIYSTVVDEFRHETAACRPRSAVRRCERFAVEDIRVFATSMFAFWRGALRSSRQMNILCVLACGVKHPTELECCLRSSAWRVAWSRDNQPTDRPAPGRSGGCGRTVEGASWG
jgi:hypothetical protein